MWQQTLAVLIVLGLLMSSLWLLRRTGLARVKLGLGSPAATRQMELLERLPLTPRHSLHLIRVADRLVLIGVSPGSCATLETLPSNHDAAQGAAGDRYRS